jgi:glycosyltransferase involved in cell wall biosynthesis
MMTEVGLPELTIAIPTRDRPGFLSVLLGSIAYDLKYIKEVLVISNGPNDRQLLDGVSERTITLLRSRGVTVTTIHLGDGGRQASQARNYAQIHCKTDFLMCVDDDMWFEPGAIQKMIVNFLELEEKHEGVPITLSALTPYIDAGYEGPKAEDILPWPPDDEKTIEIIHTPGQSMPFHLILRQNCSYRLRGMYPIRPSDALTPGVYLMRPDITIANWDTSDQSMFTDIAWSLQLEMLRGYKFFFDIGTRVYHLNAPFGGTRIVEGDFRKQRKFFDTNAKAIGMLLEERKRRCRK